MKYQFIDYPAEKHFTETVLSTRSMAVISWSQIARNLRDFAFKYCGHDCYIVHDSTMIGGYFRNPEGTKTVAVKIL